MLANSVYWVGHFERKFQTEGASLTNHCWCQKTGVIALSCVVKICAVHHLVLSQCTRMTDGQTDGQNYDSQDRASITARAVKTLPNYKKVKIYWRVSCLTPVNLFPTRFFSSFTEFLLKQDQL